MIGAGHDIMTFSIAKEKTFITNSLDDSWILVNIKACAICSVSPHIARFMSDHLCKRPYSSLPLIHRLAVKQWHQLSVHSWLLFWHYMTFTDLFYPKHNANTSLCRCFTDTESLASTQTQHADGFLFPLITMFRLELAAALYQLCSQAASVSSSTCWSFSLRSEVPADVMGRCFTQHCRGSRDSI